jgi:hypothetical protein
METIHALTASYPKRIADLAIKYALPSMHADSSYVHADGLMSYATSDPEQFRRAAIYIDKILNGAIDKGSTAGNAILQQKGYFSSFYFPP